MKSRNFWNNCPKKLEYFPKTQCPLGKLGVESKGENTQSCQWFINSEEDFFCFWKWLRKVSNADGCFEPLLQHEVAELLKHSPTKAHFTVKEAMSNLEKTKEFQLLKELNDI